jgi:hypothetical protein
METPSVKFLLLFAALFGFSAAPAFAGDGHISKSGLSHMGLAGMKAMTDVDGMSIRGTSFVSVGSFTFVTGKPPAISVKTSSGATRTASTFVVSGGLTAGGFASASAH